MTHFQRPHKSSVSESQAYAGDVTHKYYWDMAAGGFYLTVWMGTHRDLTQRFVATD